MNKIEVKKLQEFSDWLSSIKDSKTRMRLSRRIEKASQGNLGDHKSVGDGVTELREDFGPGWRMYLVNRNGTLVVMLGGGDKSSQDRDIKAAKALAKRLED
jgi:putative addiction module killer protein